MKANTLEHSIFDALNPLNLIAYLQTYGWQKVDHFGENTVIWTQHQSSTGKEFKIFLPLKREGQDFAICMKEAIKTLALFENRPQLSIKADLDTVALGDVIQIRTQDIFHTSSTLPLEYALLLHQRAKDMLASAARVAVTLAAGIEPKPYYLNRPPGDVTKYLSQIRLLAQSEPNSYVVKLISPINPELLNKQLEIPEIKPFERIVVETLMRGLNALQKVALSANQQGNFDVAPFQKIVSEGMSANLCDAITDMGGAGQYRPLEIRVSWSYMPRPLSEDISPRITFSKEVLPFIEKASNALWESRSEEIQLEGYVVALKRPESGANVGKITILGNIDGKEHKVKIELDKAHYENDAIRAHQEGIKVSCHGELRKKKNFFSLFNPLDFHLLQDNKNHSSEQLL
ncbi:hypothetical protein [Candidatus Parabeggiatoa sp. HSG14]|uniref:hypothetical protein n=1 Tax=Candidatus Parabeggiatoa sp. HSG14 TaxID=3055593 RepID=UPI0025A8A7A7|nr:hypothetical protein [Thiotrichales bacterium HSG14]